MRRENLSYETFSFGKDALMAFGYQFRNILVFGILCSSLVVTYGYAGKAESLWDDWAEKDGQDNITFPALDEETTMSWLQFMELDALDVDLNGTDEEYDKPTIPWLLFMEIDREESEREIVRMKRDERTSGSGDDYVSGSGTTPSPDVTTSGDTTTTITEVITEDTTSVDLTSSGVFTTGIVTEEMTSVTGTTEASGDFSTSQTTFSTLPVDVSTDIVTTEATTEAFTQEMTSVGGTTEGSGDFSTYHTLITTISMDNSTAIDTTESLTGTTVESSGSSTSATSMDVTTAEDEISTTVGNEETTTVEAGECANNTDCRGVNEYCFNILQSDSQCVCLAGYSRAENGSCTSPVKQFGGKLHLDSDFDENLLNPSSDIFIQYSAQYNEFLEAAYNNSLWYVSSMVLSFEKGSIIVNYEVQTSDSESVTAKTVQDTFGTFVANNSFYPNCTCDDHVCNSSNANFPPLQANISCMDAGTRNPCENNITADMCSDPTVTCSAEDGVVTCECVEDDETYQPETRVCIEALCQGGCNSPFGSCINSRCSCIWGFFGKNCENPWLFVLVIVICGLVLIALIAGVIVYFKRRNRAKYQRNAADYYANAMRQSEGRSRKSNARHFRAADWDTKTGIVTKSYKKMEDVEELTNGLRNGMCHLTFDADSQHSTNGEPVPLTTFRPDPYENRGYERQEEEQRVKEVEERPSQGRGGNDNKVFVDDESGKVREKNQAGEGKHTKSIEELRYARTPL